MTIWDRPGAPLKPETEQLLYQAWAGVRSAESLVRERELAEAATRAYRVMLRAAQALVWEEQGLRFHVCASYHAAFWDHFVRPGRIDVERHRWLLEAFAQSGRGGEYPIELPDLSAVGLSVDRAREFLRDVHRCLGLRQPFPPEGDRRTTSSR